MVEYCAQALDRLGWEPNEDKAKAWHITFRGQNNKYKALGPQAVNALVFFWQLMWAGKVTGERGPQRTNYRSLSRPWAMQATEGPYPCWKSC